MLNHHPKIAFIGCGNMAQAIIKGLTDSNYPAKNIIASNPSLPKLNKIEQKTGILTTQNNQQAGEFADVIVLAIKPQKMLNALANLQAISMQNKLIISVAAGIPCAQIANGLGIQNWQNQKPTIIRAMPNTPALINQGATGIYAHHSIKASDKALCENIFNSVGKLVWVDKESQIDMVTAIAGSSPAYVFFNDGSHDSPSDTVGIIF